MADGIVFSGQRILVLQSLQSQLLGLIQESRFGIEKSKFCASKLLYLPTMGANIERTFANCVLNIKIISNMNQ